MTTLGLAKTAWGWPERPLHGRIWTSRYQAADAIIASGLAPTRVTLYPPRWRLRFQLVATIKELAPTRALFGIEDRAAFTTAFDAQLDAVGTERITELIDAIRRSANADPVLLCFEDLTKTWCHRQAFAHWWFERTGETVMELDPARPPNHRSSTATGPGCS